MILVDISVAKIMEPRFKGTEVKTKIITAGKCSQQEKQCFFTIDKITQKNEALNGNGFKR